MKKVMTIVLFYGAVWGFLEASLGGLLHFILFPYTGQIMGSIAFVLLLRAMRKGVPVTSVCMIASLAAAIKLVDLYIFPGNPGAVLRPAMAILSQGMAFALVTAVFHLPEQRGKRLLGGLLVMGWISLGLSHVLAATFLEPLRELQHIYLAFFVNVPLMILAVFTIDSLTRHKTLRSAGIIHWKWSSLLLFLTFVCKYIFHYAAL